MGCCQTGPLQHRRYKFRTTNFRNIQQAKEADKKPSGKEHSRIILRISDISTAQELIFQIRKIIINNRNQYGLLSEQIFIFIFQSYDTIFYPFNQLYTLITHLLQYMIECYNRTLPKMQQKIQNNFFSQFGQRISCLQKEALSKNKNFLRIMSYLAQNQKDYGSYLDLKFDLNFQQAMTVTDKVLDLFYYDERSLFFLTNYLYVTCNNLQKKQYDLNQIQQILVNFIEQVIQKYPELPQIPDSDEAHQIQDYKIQQKAIKFNQIQLQKFQESQRKVKLISFIMAQAKQAQINYNQFVHLVKDLCLQTGNNFNIGLKIKNAYHNRGIQRVIQKIIGQKSGFIMYQPRDYLGRNNIKILQGYFNQEERQYQRQLTKIYGNYSDPIVFKVQDMLRAKCYFKNISHINECVNKLKKKIEKNQSVKLIEICNRFRGTPRVSDIVLRIMVGKTLTQLRLCLQRTSYRNQFVSTLHKIISSKFISPLTMLKFMNQDLKRDFLEDAQRCFTINNSNKTQSQAQIYQMPKTFKNLQLKFEYLMKITNFQPKSNYTGQSQILKILKQQLNFLIEQHQTFKQSYSQTKKKIKNNGDFYVNFDAEASFKQYEKYLKQLQKQNTKARQNQEQIGQTCNSMGKIKQRLGQYKDAFNYYQKSAAKFEAVQVKPTQRLARAFINVGLMLWAVGNSQKALNYYYKYLDVQYKLRGQQNFSQVQTFSRVIQQYDKQKVYDNALLYYSSCFQVQQRLKQEECDINWAPIFYKLGLVYFNQGNYQQTIKYYQKCIKIQQKSEIPLVSQETMAASLAQIYWRQKKYKLALSYYKKCLEIRKKKTKQQINWIQILYKMALIQTEQGQDRQALQILQECLHIQEQFLGIGAFQSAQTLHSIGFVYYKLGNHNKALDYYRKSLDIKQRADGQLSIDAVITLQKVGDMFRQQKRYKQAFKYFEKCLSIVQKVKGNKSIESIVFLNKISQVHIDIRSYETALDYYSKCLQIKENTYGSQSMQVAETLNNIAYVHDIQDNVKQALQFYGQSLQIYKKNKKAKGQYDKNYLKILRDMDNLNIRQEKSQ